MAAASSQINQIIRNLIDTAWLVIGLLFVVAILVFVWGIVKFIAAAGNPEQIKKARAILWWGVIALTVLASVTGLIVVIQTYFGITGNPVVPIPQFLPIPAGSSGTGSGSCSSPNPPIWCGL